MATEASTTRFQAPTEIKEFVNLGPLSTTTSFPASCTNTLYDFQTPYLGIDLSGPATAGCALSECCPSGNFYTEDFAWYSSYYSPAVCPQDWTVCPPPTLASQRGETIGMCCPSGYECPQQEPFYGACGSIYPTGEHTATVAVMDNLEFQQQESSTVVTDDTYDTWAMAYPLQIRWKADDLVSTSDSASSSASSGASSDHASSSVTSSAGSSSSDGPSPGTIAGAVVGGVVGLALLIGLVAWFLWRRRKSKRGQTESREMGNVSGSGPTPPPGYWADNKHVVHTEPAHTVSASPMRDAGTKESYLHDTSPIGELDGNATGTPAQTRAMELP